MADSDLGVVIQAGATQHILATGELSVFHSVCILDSKTSIFKHKGIGWFSMGAIGV